MNRPKKKIKTNVSSISNSSVTVGNKRLEIVDGMFIFGIFYPLVKSTGKITKRVQLGWAAFGKLDDILKSDNTL